MPHCCVEIDITIMQIEDSSQQAQQLAAEKFKSQQVPEAAHDEPAASVEKAVESDGEVRWRAWWLERNE